MDTRRIFYYDQTIKVRSKSFNAFHRLVEKQIKISHVDQVPYFTVFYHHVTDYFLTLYSKLVNRWELSVMLPPSKTQSVKDRKGTVMMYMKKLAVAEMLGCSARSVDLWKARYGLPFIKVGQVVRFDSDAVKAWFDGQQDGKSKKPSEQ